MSSIRQEKASALLRRELSLIFQQNMSTMFGGKMITVTNVRTTPDLGVAKVYLSFFPSGSKEANMKMMDEKNHHVRGLLGKVVGKQLRIVPELQFFTDDSMDYFEEIDSLLKKSKR